jgi:hypothetical protein
MSRRHFTLEEASALLPRVRAVVAKQIERRGAIERQLARLAERTGTYPEAVVEKPDDPPEVRAIKHDLIARIQEYQSAWNELEDQGLVIKDPRTGLVDFFSRIEGRTVFLCWRFGEDAISHFHELDAGFAGRKPLAGAIRARLYN